MKYIGPATATPGEEDGEADGPVENRLVKARAIRLDRPRPRAIAVD